MDPSFFLDPIPWYHLPDMVYIIFGLDKFRFKKLEKMFWERF